MNRYVYLLSAILTMAQKHGYVSSNSCKGIEKEEESDGRTQYLKNPEEGRLLMALSANLAFLQPALIVSLGTGMRKSELVRLKVEHINFSSLELPYRVKGQDGELPPNWLLVVKSKNKQPRPIPMNEAVRSTLQELVEGAAGDELVFSIARNGVSLSTLRSGFMKACELAGITYGTKQIGGITCMTCVTHCNPTSCTGNPSARDNGSDGPLIARDGQEVCTSNAGRCAKSGRHLTTTRK